MVFDAEGNMWCGQNWLAGSQSGVRKSIGGGLIKFSPNGTSLSPAITGFTGWEWTASGGVRPWHSTKSGSGHPEIAHGVQSDSASADPDLKGFHLGRIVGGKTQDRIRLVADGLVRFVNSSLEAEETGRSWRMNSTQLSKSAKRAYDKRKS